MKKSVIISTCILFILFGSAVSFAQTPGTKKWSYKTSFYITTCPAIGDDGTIYVGAQDHKLYAFNPNGSVKWTLSVDLNDTYNSPAIDMDGTIYVSSEYGRLYAVNPDGTLKWTFIAGACIESSPAIGQDGTIYVGSHDTYLYAINPDGTRKWAFKTGWYVNSSPAVADDGTIYVGSNDSTLYAINPDGSQKWTYKANGRVYSSPAIDSDGTIYVGSWDSKLHAINPDGTQKWEFSGGNSSPAIGSDGTIYAGSWDQYFYAINPDGTQKWKYRMDAYIESAPAIDNEGTIYVGCGDAKIYAIYSDGSQKWAYTTGKSIDSSPAIGSDGTIYVGSNDYRFYAIYNTECHLADSPWPKFHLNSKNTGSLPLITLPVELTAFQGKFADNKIYLSWTTVSETNNLGFDIERRESEAEVWQKAAFLKGNGTTTVLKHYEYSEPAPDASTAEYRLKQIDFDGTSQYSETVKINLLSNITHPVLMQNFPNPFNPETTIQYTLPATITGTSKVKITIWNTLGEQVKTLVDSWQNTGTYKITWDGTNEQNQPVNSGFYFCRFETGEFQKVLKLALIK